MKKNLKKNNSIDITKKNIISHKLKERYKELNALYTLDKLKEKDIKKLITKIVKIIPPAWQYPEITGARIKLNDYEAKTPNFRKTKWMQSKSITINNNKIGVIEVSYLKAKPKEFDGPFLKEERNLINSFAIKLGIFIEKKGMKNELKEFNQKQTAYLENSPVCTKIIDFDLNLQYMSRAGTIGLGIKDITKFYGKPYPFYFYPKSFKEIMTKNLKKAIRTGKIITQEAPVVDLGGNEKWFHSTITPINENNNKYLMVVSVNTTKKKQTEIKLKTSEDKYRGIIRNSIEGFMTIDLKGNILDVNDSYSKMVGYSKNSLLTKNISELDIIHNTPQKISAITKQILNGKSSSFETKHKAKNEKIINIEVNIQASSNKKVGFAFIKNITEQKNAEQNLINERNIAQNYLDIAGVMIIGINKKGEIFQINNKGEQILEDSKKNIVGKNWFDNYIRKSEIGKIKKVFNKVLNGKNKLTEYYENSIMTAKGNEKIIAWHNAPLKDSENNIIGILSSGEDITKRKQMEGEMQKLAAIAKNSHELISMSDPKGNMIFINKTGTKILGVNAKDTNKHHILDVIPKNYLPIVERDLLPSLLKKGRWDGELEYKNVKTGKITPVHVMAFTIKDKTTGKPLYFVNVSHDITEINEKNKQLKDSHLKLEDKVKERTFALAESEEKYRVLYDSSRDAVMTLAPPTWKFTGGNVSTLALFGVKDVRQLTSLSPWKFSPKYQPDGQISRTKAKKMIKIAMKNGTNFFEWTHQTVNGVPFFASVLLSRVEERGKEYLQATVRDITEQKKAENKIFDQINKLNELDELKRKFLTISSHELKTPLTPAKIQTQMLLQGDLGQLNEKQNKSFEIILRNIDRLDELIGDILEISSLQAEGFELKLKKVNMNDLIKSIINEITPLTKEKNIEFHSKIDTLPALHIDEGRIKEVFSNLIENAIKFTKKGRISINAKLQKNEILFEVKDSGIGIEKKYFKEIFLPFVQLEPTFTREHGGTGLGLAIIEGIIKKHNGEIGVKSKVGNGTTFFFTLPLKKRRNKK
jgi:PAS domain S-box-containing protein